MTDFLGWQLPWGAVAAIAGLIAGTVLGLAARLGDFCTLGALESALYGGDQRRLRLWGIVLAVAILATQAGAAAGWIDLGETYYHKVGWMPLASILGGLTFGYGMALAGNCGFGALVRLGSGDLRAMVIVIILAISGFAALSGPLAPIRHALFPQIDSDNPQSFAALFQRLDIPFSPFVALVVVGLLVWALSCPTLRASRRSLLWGVAAGLAVAFSFAATSWVARESLGAVPVEGPSFVAAVGRALLWLMTASGGGLGYTVGTVFGITLGSFAGSMWRGLFRWEACEDPRELGRQIGGAALMGIGGVVAMGCSIGQGVSAVAALAWSGPVTLAAIVVGASFGLRQLIESFQPE
ncbi:YeeE/YedE family protein [Paracoccus alkenifer]|uniref:Uncharacterized protein n=1 Tax=Paracoccus alkenifer TaxID=65735 RepID=A0A1H6KA00_9RHOB|nr:YeeE/YedE family protein [Paracoccus alkenifer]SEH68628.1 hypothetical protein SAMN04488075_0783 [Paracoccus alkenifer]